MRPEALTMLKRGVVIPAMPLALDAARRFDEQHQRALIRYYAAAGAGGLAVGVHTTQFEIREPRFGLFRPVLEFAAGILRECEQTVGRPLVKIAGVCGATPQAVGEAELARSLGYDTALLSLGALRHSAEDALIEHCRQIARIIPVMGFYLQPAVGGRVLPYTFWRRFAEIENVVAVKIAPFNRYQTLDVIRAVAHAGRADDIALYTGNDDNIVMDLVTPFSIATPSGQKTIRIRGGLLGQWAVWTKRAVELLEQIHALADAGDAIPFEMLRTAAALTDANAAIFDAANNFAGCIPGINEVLRRQGLLAAAHCLDPRLVLSPGQGEEITRVRRDYTSLTDDDFVRENLSNWLR